MHPFALAVVTSSCKGSFGSIVERHLPMRIPFFTVDMDDLPMKIHSLHRELQQLIRPYTGIDVEVNDMPEISQTADEYLD